MNGWGLWYHDFPNSTRRNAFRLPPIPEIQAVASKLQTSLAVNRSLASSEHVSALILLCESLDVGVTLQHHCRMSLATANARLHHSVEEFMSFMLAHVACSIGGSVHEQWQQDLHHHCQLCWMHQGPKYSCNSLSQEVGKTNS